MWQCDYNVLFSCILPTGASSSDSDGEGAVSHLRSGTMPQYVCFNVNLLTQWTSDPKQVNWDLEPPLRPIVFKWALKRSLKRPNTNQRPGHTPYTRCRRSGWKIQPGLSVFHTFSELKKKKRFPNRQKRGQASRVHIQSLCGSRCLCLNSSHYKRRHMYLCMFEIAVFF